MSADTLAPSRTVILRKNAREQIRVSLDHFKGMELLNVRTWFLGEDGEMKPGKQGIAIRLELAADLAQAIREVSHG